jgi:tRNA nucleotidyltransferase (CCA-adding enzyme)
MSVKITIPEYAGTAMRELEANGFESFVVGGCVRDSIMGKNANDWDMTTSAEPQETLEVFKDFRTIPTGIKHGTITVLIDKQPLEITTFRIDGEYTDNRRPDSVNFTRDIENDLSRRDFTVNAMAYNEKDGIVDLFGGMEDIKNKIIRCVGDPDTRFNEDALRIMRALRFASTYGFVITEDTSSAVHCNAALLNNIAKERINTELCKLLHGQGVLEILLNYNDIIATIIPEMKPCIGFNQNNRYHQYTVYDHIAHAVANYTGSDTTVKAALLLHDIGKPTCYTEDENGGHFHGHGIPSSDIAKEVVARLRFDNHAQRDIVELVLYHDAILDPTVKVAKRWLNKIGEQQLFRLLDIRMADILAHSEGTQESRIERCIALRTIVNNVIASRQCFQLKDMAITGDDLILEGMKQGKEIGETLKWLLEMVINGEVENNKEQLLSLVRLRLKMSDKE